MQSSYSTFNTKCHQTQYSKVPLVPRKPQGILPQFDGNITETFLEDMETILEDYHVPPEKPRAVRDLSTIMIDPTEDLLEQPVPRLCLRERLETYLEEALEKTSPAKMETGQEPSKKEEEPMATAKKERTVKKRWGRKKKKKQIVSDKPIVWTIRPGFHKNGSLQFKFSTDAGAFFILKDKEALSSLKIIKKKANDKTFFQIYALDARSSKIVGPDQVTDLMADVMAKAKAETVAEPGLCEEIKVDNLEARNAPGYKLIRYILRRRWKNLVKRQIGIAMGNGQKSIQSWMVVFPLVAVWKMLTRRSRAFP